MAERLAAVLRFRTVTPGAAEENQDLGAFAAMQGYLQNAFPKAHAGLDVEQIGDANAVLMAWHGQECSSALPWMFVSHQDVVPVDNEKLWRHPPFSGMLAEGHVWGRGALDLKVTMTAVLEAVESLLDEGFRPRRSVYLAFGGDEESGDGHGRRSFRWRVG
ncbi:MAG: M20/M25/M40 family metallo-hydrolase, partial [Pseudomonadota bacterium]